RLTVNLANAQARRRIESEGNSTTLGSAIRCPPRWLSRYAPDFRSGWADSLCTGFPALCWISATVFLSGGASVFRSGMHRISVAGFCFWISEPLAVPAGEVTRRRFG